MSGLSLVLVDSSSWIEALRPTGSSIVRARVHRLLDDGIACWCDIVALELWHGARGQKERKVLAELQRTLTCLEVDRSVWQASLRLATRARDGGLTVPSADLIIAACAFHNNLKIEHCDRHLQLLEKYR